MGLGGVCTSERASGLGLWPAVRVRVRVRVRCVYFWVRWYLLGLR